MFSVYISFYPGHLLHLLPVYSYVVIYLQCLKKEKERPKHGRFVFVIIQAVRLRKHLPLTLVTFPQYDVLHDGTPLALRAPYMMLAQALLVSNTLVFKRIHPWI
jgi:hypothetical protein